MQQAPAWAPLTMKVATKAARATRIVRAPLGMKALFPSMIFQGGVGLLGSDVSSVMVVVMSKGPARFRRGSQLVMRIDHHPKAVVERCVKLLKLTTAILPFSTEDHSARLAPSFSLCLLARRQEYQLSTMKLSHFVTLAVVPLVLICSMRSHLKTSPRYHAT